MNKEGKLTETKKPISFKLGGVTFGKDYQGLKSQNGGIRYYYQKGTVLKIWNRILVSLLLKWVVLLVAVIKIKLLRN